jgi:tyrosyl-tRNA synthetase
VLFRSEPGAVYLAPHRTSPYRFYQYWIRVDDRDVGRFLRYFTFLPRGRVEELDELTERHPERREAQRVLAWEVTSLVHGESEAARARHASEVLFTDDIASLDEDVLLDVFAEAPSSTEPRSELDGDGLALVDALVRGGVTPSKSAARTAITQGGIYVNNRRETDVERRLTAGDSLHGRYVVLRRGKRDHHLVRFE